MVRKLLFLIATSSLIPLGIPSSAGSQSNQTPAFRPEKFIFLLPDGFKGWLCVDFGVPGAPPLPREGDARVIRPRQGEVLATSDKTDTPGLLGEAWFEINGQRKSLPGLGILQPVVSRTGSREPCERQCTFVGTMDERESAGAAPGSEKPPGNDVAIPKEERQALEALYKSTDGDHWTHRGESI